MTSTVALADLMDRLSRVVFLLELVAARVSCLEDRLDRIEAEADALIQYGAQRARLN
jgi:hypothetical protein